MVGTKEVWDHGKWTQKYIYAETLQFSIPKATSDSLEGNVYLSQMILALLGEKKNSDAPCLVRIWSTLILSDKSTLPQEFAEY